jgi:DNA-binding CsgD family transcriptional regulator
MIAANLGGALMAADSDKAAILAVLEAETDAWMHRDFEALAKHWVHSPQTRRLVAFAALGTHVDEGWEEIGARLRRMIARYPRPYDPRKRLRRENVNVVVGKDIAWVSYDQIGTGNGDEFELVGLQHELKIFHRVDGTWKIGCLVLMQRGVEHAICPLIEVDDAGKVLWMNQPAEDRISDHPGLIVANGRLRTRRRANEAALSEAIGWAFAELRDALTPFVARMSRLVQLGEDNEGDPCFCWVVIDDGKALVTFDDARMVARRIDSAREAYGLSPAQARLARLIAEGNDLAMAAESLGVSINTVRTHLQRMFDRTGTRSQTALVRALLSAEAPNR